MSAEQVKADLASARSREEADAIFKSAYISGFTLQELGDMIGVTREYIRQRIARPIEPSMMRSYEPHERVVRKVQERRKYVASTKRILGLRLSSPALQVPVETLNELARLRELTTEVRGWTPLDSPARQAIKPFGDLLHKTIADYEIPQTHLERMFGLSQATLRSWLRNHGYEKQVPSQKSYQGVYSDPKTRGSAKKGPRLVVGASCKNEHVMTESTIGHQRVGRYCKVCKRDSAKRQYRKRAGSLGS